MWVVDKTCIRSDPRIKQIVLSTPPSRWGQGYVGGCGLQFASLVQTLLIRAFSVFSNAIILIIQQPRGEQAGKFHPEVVIMTASCSSWRTLMVGTLRDQSSTYTANGR